MPRISRSELLDRQLVDQLHAIISDASNPGYVKMRAMGTLNGIRKRQDKVAAERAKASAARRAQRKGNQPVLSWLPERGEGHDAYHARMARQKAALSAD
jgi:hypothetical protein